VKFRTGPNQLRAVGRKDGVELADQISVAYQTVAWDKPARLVAQEVARKGEVVTVEVRALDAASGPCLRSSCR